MSLRLNYQNGHFLKLEGGISNLIMYSNSVIKNKKESNLSKKRSKVLNNNEENRFDEAINLNKNIFAYVFYLY